MCVCVANKHGLHSPKLPWMRSTSIKPPPKQIKDQINRGCDERWRRLRKRKYVCVRVCTCVRAAVSVRMCVSSAHTAVSSVTFRAECRQQHLSVVEMAALRQEHRYGLSCAKINKNAPNQTLFHVKLTDTAIRTLEAYQNLKVRQLIRFANFRACESFFFLYLYLLAS